MILKVDHVALLTTDTNRSINYLNALGYSLFFHEQNIVNLDIKRSLLKQFSKNHDLVLLNCEGSFGIELINYGYKSDKLSFINPIFENIPLSINEAGENSEVVDMADWHEFIDCQDARKLYKKSNEITTFKFNKIIVKTYEIEKSINFFVSLGFVLVEINMSATILEFKSLFNIDKLFIYLQKVERVKEHYFLDDGGFNCIALLSSSVPREREKLIQNGYKVTAIEKLQVNKNVLDIFFVIGPAGEIVEIININK